MCISQHLGLRVALRWFITRRNGHNSSIQFTIGLQDRTFREIRHETKTHGRALIEGFKFFKGFRRRQIIILSVI